MIKENIQKYQLWYCDDGEYSFFPEGNESARKLLSEGSVLIWEVEAASWEEAQKKKHDYLKWESYKPI